jgi:GNAT superfamily N-acetyltransferase
MTDVTDNHLISLELGNGVRVTASDDPASPVLTRFFAGYDRAFLLPDEREELDGFKACLALNGSHRHAFSRTHSELIAIFEDIDGALLGGANFLATAIDQGVNLPPATIALNYVYVEEAARGRGLLRVILCAVRELALIALGLDHAGPPPAIFIEQNDPLRLTAEEYAADTAHSGTDQFDRLAIWARLGSRIVDFPYVQPALSAQQQADDGLVYAAVDYPGTDIDARLLHDHLQSFFRISVLKGAPEVPGDGVGTQLAALAQRSQPVALLPVAPALAWIRAGRPTQDFESFRALAAAAQRGG